MYDPDGAYADPSTDGHPVDGTMDAEQEAAFSTLVVEDHSPAESGRRMAAETDFSSLTKETYHGNEEEDHQHLVSLFR